MQAAENFENLVDPSSGLTHTRYGNWALDGQKNSFGVWQTSLNKNVNFLIGWSKSQTLDERTDYLIFDQYKKEWNSASNWDYPLVICEKKLNEYGKRNFL